MTVEEKEKLRANNPLEYMKIEYIQTRYPKNNGMRSIILR